jgi:hypothetical protein
MESARQELRERIAFIADRSPRAATKLLEQIVDAVVPASEHRISSVRTACPALGRS